MKGCENMDNEAKPLLTAQELIKSMKDRGITFLKITEEEAKDYILHKNNYFRTACYRKNFPQITINGKKMYKNLDFFHLTELSTLDMRYRYIVYQMCLDIEHALKVYLIRYFESNLKDPYDCVKEFLDNNEYVKLNISRMRNKSYPNNLINKYFSFEENTIKDVNCPVWALVEILTFGDFLEFYFFCQEKYAEFIHSSRLLRNKSQLYLIKNLRNACAHNNCIFENLSIGQSTAPTILRDKIAEIRDIKQSSRRKRLTVRPVLEFTSLLLVYEDVVGEIIKKHRITELEQLFFERMLRHASEFESNELILANYRFIKKIIYNIFKDILTY